ncbi:hypothetical protein M9H77_30743 [Catharanthus roseus]|uniref:Uncharacterized protein n=1 Tax=Catharanthus roseus TaxID=4058 RepID=A0ACB9ZZ13_CATRO|nr:hypothetical protein M9H77_30743 [Catharanthus roseus]
MYLLMDTMTCRFKILIHFIKVDTKEDHKLEVKEEGVLKEEYTIKHKNIFQDMKHDMKTTYASIARFLSGLNRDIANQLELYPYTTYEDIVVPKPQASTYKNWPKKDDTPKIAFKDNSKPKVKEKGRSITNPIRWFKCNSVGYIAINCSTKGTFVFREDLNGWIEKSNDDCQEGIIFVVHIDHESLKFLKG